MIEQPYNQYEVYTDEVATYNEFVPKGWMDEPVDVTPEEPFLFMSRRKKPQGSNRWEDFAEPTLWAVYGKSVISVESKYQINNDKNNAEIKLNEIKEFYPLYICKYDKNYI